MGRENKPARVASLGPAVEHYHVSMHGISGIFTRYTHASSYQVCLLVVFDSALEVSFVATRLSNSYKQFYSHRWSLQ